MNITMNKSWPKWKQLAYLAWNNDDYVSYKQALDADIVKNKKTFNDIRRYMDNQGYACLDYDENINEYQLVYMSNDVENDFKVEQQLQKRLVQSNSTIDNAVCIASLVKAVDMVAKEVIKLASIVKQMV